MCFSNNLAKSTIAPSSGIYQEVEDGPKIYGKSDTVNLMPAIQNLVTSKTIYLKWKANGNGHPVNVGVELYTDSDNLVPVDGY